MNVALIVFLAVFALVALYAVGIYNRLVSLRNRLRNAFSQIDVQLTRRHDLIPNLVETAKAYMKHERGTLEEVILARNQAVAATKTAAAKPEDAQAMGALIGAETALTASLGRLFALSESYPELKASETMGRLMEELGSTENKVAFSRQAYNDAVMVYNTKREQFPDNLIAGPMGFSEARLFELEKPEHAEAVKVSFD